MAVAIRAKARAATCNSNCCNWTASRHPAIAAPEEQAGPARVGRRTIMRVTELKGPLDEPIVHEAWRWRVAGALRSGSALLARLADTVAEVRAAARRQRRPELEFYAEAGAPEGALFIDGRLVGRLPGVRRL